MGAWETGSTEGLDFFFSSFLLPVNFQVAAHLDRTSLALEYLLRVTLKQIAGLDGVHEL